MQALGNDFIVLSQSTAQELGVFDNPELRRQLCDRRYGFGCDQLVIIGVIEVQTALPSARIWFYNADGSAAEACGNGTRSAIQWLERYTGKKNWQVLVEKKHLNASLVAKNLVETQMGTPELVDSSVALPESIAALWPVAPRHVQLVTLGNPHFVCVFSSPVDGIPVATIGPALEYQYAERANVEFVSLQQLSSGAYPARVWERGAKETPACGSGACAVAYALAGLGYASMPVTLALPGGTLRVDRHEDMLVLTGETKFVFFANLVDD